MTTQKATFAAGCFWGVEATFRQIPGVLQTTVGYTGGITKNPTYRQVCTGKTGHAEAVEIIFDPTKVTYEYLVEIFFKSHDPTTLNRQGPDIGTQYRSAIFTHDSEQNQIAERIKTNFEQKKNGRKIVTEIVVATEFYPAEEYHQQYFEKEGYHPCVNFLPLPKKTGTLSQLK